MLVYFDFQILLAQRFGGISRYFYEIIPRLEALGVQAEINCVHNHNYYFADKLGIRDASLIDKGIFWFVNKFKAKRDVRRTRYDIIHPTYYYMTYDSGAKIVTTIHDIIPEKFRTKEALIAAKKKAVHQADRIIAISQNTKNDILALYPDVDPERISVVYHGASMMPQDTSSRKFARMDGRDYVLFVGLRGRYKNFAGFFAAMKPILEAHKDVNIFCAGGGAFSRDEQEMIRGYESRVFQGGLSDDELIDAYSNALCFVFPSKYEGFGLPVLEAFACNCPLVCSRATSLPEVALDGAEYFDPEDTDSMTESIMRVLESESLREDLRVRGRERLKFFSWEKSARETLSCYESALAE